MLTLEQRSDFERHGCVRLAGAIEASVTRELCAYVWDLLVSRHQIRRDTPETWRRPRPKGIQSLARSAALNAICSATVREAIDDLFGCHGWEEPEHWGQLLISLPGEGRWKLPHNTWHLDLPRRETGHRLPGLQIFACLDRVLPKGGGTVAVTGSHRLVESILAASSVSRSGASASVRKSLSQSIPWFGQLWSAETESNRERHFMESPTLVDDIPVQVIEMTGEPGDVILMHSYVFHAAAPNSRSSPRIVATQRLAAV